MNQNPQFTQAMPPAYYQPPPWADPQRLAQKELRRSASRLAFAALASFPLQIIVVNVGFLLLTACGFDPYTAFGPGFVGGMPATAFYLLSSVSSFVSLLLPFSLFLLIGKRRLTDVILVEKNGTLNSLLIIPAAVCLCMLMNIPAGWLSQLFEMLGLNGAVNTESFTVGSVTDILTMLLSIVLVAPVVEEFAFRGVTVAIMRRWGDWPAVILSALIFGMAHYSFQALPVVVMGGFVMALLYVKTRNIWLNIIVHFLNNLIATLPIIVEYYCGTDIANLVNSISFLAVIVFGAAAGIALLIRRLRGHAVLGTPIQNGQPVRKKALWLFANPGFITYFVVFVIMAVVELYAV